MKIHDSSKGEKVEFKTLEPMKVKMYVCGPTVYDLGHLGHGRSAVAFDVIRRYFIYKGYEVKFVFNYTDIDDKMINRAAEEGCTVAELAERIIPEYEQDYGALRVMVPDVLPKATEHVEEMVEIVKKLETAGHVYVLDDGVYFDVSTYEPYGEFSGQNLEELQMGARVDVKSEKRNPQDFVLWKFKKDGEPSWESPWGEGRPGWHIECSAMSFKHLGEKFDIHGGGLDLLFPHHECEVAQSRGAFGSGAFAQNWMHNGFINVDNEKMSKSLNNFFTLRDIFAKYDPVVVRFMLVQTHYRNPVNFSDVLLEQAKAGLERLHGFVRMVKDFRKRNLGPGVGVFDEVFDAVSKLRTGFEGSMNEDFDTSGALGALFEFVKEVNTYVRENDLTGEDAKFILDYLKQIDGVLQVIFVEEEEVDEEVEALIAERNKAREEKNFARSDEIRDQLKERGIVLEDGPNGTTWKRA